MRIALIKYVFHSANPKRQGKQKQAKHYVCFGCVFVFFFAFFPHSKHKHKCWSVWQANKHFTFHFSLLVLQFVFFFVLLSCLAYYLGKNLSQYA